MADRYRRHGSGCTCAFCRPMLQVLGGTGELYRTRPGWGVTEWHFACYTCDQTGHGFYTAAFALQSFYRHRASTHGLTARQVLDTAPVKPVKAMLELPVGDSLERREAPGGAGELYRTAGSRSRPGWHWRCSACEEAGHGFEAAPGALRAFYGHRTSAHGFSPAGAAASVTSAVELGPLHDMATTEPVPSPSLTYEQVIAACSGYSDVAASVAAWVALAAVLSSRPDWRFGLSDDGAATASWTWTAHPEYWATASLSPKGTARFELFRSDDDDEESMWELAKPQDVPPLAEAIAAGAPEPPAVRLGPWTEEPFLAWMRGEAPPPWEGPSVITLP